VELYMEFMERTLLFKIAILKVMRHLIQLVLYISQLSQVWKYIKVPLL